MNLEEILAIAGRPGLFKLITRTRAGFIAESLLDNKRVSVTARTNVSLLSEIAIYTLREEVPLEQIFKTIAARESYDTCSVDPNGSKDALEAYFFDILPEYDEDRVYPSDIKKVIKWYNLLVGNELIKPDADNGSEEEE